MSGYGKTLDIGNMFGSNSGFKLHIVVSFVNQMMKKNCSPPNFYLPIWENFAPPYTSPNLEA